MPATVLAGDGLLVRLVAARRGLALPLARAAALVVAHRVWVYSGYKTQGDYTRECLHREPRWLRDLACQARDEDREPTRREETEPDATDDRAVVRQLVPPDVKLAFEVAFELHRCLVGREVAPVEFVEGLIGEAASAGCFPPPEFEPRLHRRGRATAPEVAGRAQPEAVTAKLRGRASLSMTLSSSSGTRTADHCGQHVPLGLQTPALRQALHQLAEFVRLRTRLRRLEVRLAVLETRCGARGGTSPRDQQGDRGRACIPSRHHRDLRRLSEILAALLRLENGFEIAIGDLLLELHEHRAWKILGVAGLETSAERRLGLGRATARRRVWLARALRKMHAVRSAYETGELGFMSATWVARALQHTQADADVQQTWISHAQQTTRERQRDEERRRERERLRALIAIAQESTSARCDGMVAASHARIPGTTVASNTETAHFSPRPARHLKEPRPMADEAWHAALRRVPGDALAELFGLGYGLLERIVRGGPQLRVPLSLALPEVDAAALLGCIEAARRQLTALGSLELAPDAECRLGPAARLARTFVGGRERVPEWVGLLALLEEYVLAHDRPEKRARRSGIAERDGYRCMAPGCTSRHNLQVHHVHYRSQHGGDEAENLVLLCAFHHLQGEHGGLACCRGRAPLDILWRLGAAELATWFRNERRVMA